ncbi:MAG: carbohydrate-binding domain-containing protein, partial [Eubacterium sp.]|nr:carbohydrate-binding domain-containing protein [Eubacterium sp.]
AGGYRATITINGGNIYVNASGDGIDSNKNAVINGGTLFVIGSDVGGDAGIDTDAGYVINGGTVVALGSDMIETPQNSGKQNTIAFSLNEKINKDTMVSLMKGDKAILSFVAPKSFKTLIISSASLINGDYKLFTEDYSSKETSYAIDINGSFTTKNPVLIDNQDTFKVDGVVNSFGNSKGGMAQR